MHLSVCTLFCPLQIWVCHSNWRDPYFIRKGSQVGHSSTPLPPGEWGTSDTCLTRRRERTKHCIFYQLQIDDRDVDVLYNSLCCPLVFFTLDELHPSWWLMTLTSWARVLMAPLVAAYCSRFLFLYFTETFYFLQNLIMITVLPLARWLGYI